MRKPTNPKETAQLARLEAGDFAAFKQELLASVRLYADIEAGRTCMGSPVLAENVLAGIEWQIDALSGGVVPSAPSLTDIFAKLDIARRTLGGSDRSETTWLQARRELADVRTALRGLSSAAAPPDVIALAEKYIASGVLEQSNKMNHPVAVRAFAAWARGELEVSVGGVDSGGVPNEPNENTSCPRCHSPLMPTDNGMWMCRSLTCGWIWPSPVRDSGGVAPAGPWVVERFYTQDKWFVRRGIEIPGEMSQFALHWFRSEAEAEAVCDVLNRVAETRPASSGNTLLNDVVGGSSRSGEALPKP